MGNAVVSEHPLRAWRTAPERGFSAADVSALVQARGFKFRPRTVLAVEEGWRHPGYLTCEAIEQITQGAVTVSQLRHWPLREGAMKSVKKKRA